MRGGSEQGVATESRKTDTEIQTGTIGLMPFPLQFFSPLLLLRHQILLVFGMQQLSGGGEIVVVPCTWVRASPQVVKGTGARWHGASAVVGYHIWLHLPARHHHLVMSCHVVSWGDKVCEVVMGLGLCVKGGGDGGTANINVRKI